MPNLPISQLPELTAITLNAEFAVAQGGVTYKIKSGYVSSGSLYGSFSDTKDQAILADRPQAMTADTIDFSNGVSLISGRYFTVASGGTFNVQFSAQVKQGAGSALMSIWFRKNGFDIPNSATQMDLQNNNSYVFALNYLVSLASSDTFEIYWASNSNNTTIEHFPAAPNIDVLYDRPAIPSIIVTITQV